MPLSPGQLLQHDRYRIETSLGRGGMGTVYRAADLSLNIPVAIKENLGTSSEAQKQFNREATILARLTHPNLPRVTDYFIISGQGQYLVMDFVEGEDLQSMLERLGRLPEPQVLNWTSQICDALAYLHSQPAPIIHRDIKPANIRIRPDGRAMLVDFGIAKVYDPHTATTVGARAVTPGYSPPEQYGAGNTDARSDIYALGATLFTLLTGQKPPESVDRVARNVPLPQPHELNGAISPQVEQAILRSTEISTERRFQTAQELRDALTHPAEPPTLISQSPVVPPTMIVGRPTATAPAPALAGAGKPPGPSPASARRAAGESPAARPRPGPRRPVWPYFLAGFAVFLLLAGLCLGGGYFAWVAINPTPTVAAARPAETQPALPTQEPVIPAIPAPTFTPVLPPTQPPSPTPPPSPVPPLPPTPLPPLPTHVPPNHYQTVAAIKPPDPKQTLRGVATNGPFVYVLSTQGMLYVYETPARDPNQPFAVADKPLQQLATDNGNGLLKVGPFLYGYGYRGLSVFDLSDPANPVPGYSLPEHILFGLARAGDLLIGPGQDGFAIFSLADPAQPRQISFTETEKGAMHFAAAVFENRLYLSELTGVSGQNRMLVYDIRDPGAPRQLAVIDHSPLGYHYLIMMNQLVVCADYAALETWSLADPTHPSMNWTEPAQARVCAQDSDNLLTNNLAFRVLQMGARAFDKFDPGAGQSDGFPYGSAVEGPYVYLTQATQVQVLVGRP